VFLREEFRGGQGGFAGGMHPIRGRELVAEGSIRRDRLKCSASDVPVDGNCMHHAEMHCLRRAARASVRKEATDIDCIDCCLRGRLRKQKRVSK
jgi:hypothetical protein